MKTFLGLDGAGITLILGVIIAACFAFYIAWSEDRENRQTERKK